MYISTPFCTLLTKWQIIQVIHQPPWHATTRSTSHKLLLPRVRRGHCPRLSLRQFKVQEDRQGLWNSQGEHQITRLKKWTMTEGTRGPKLWRGWMNDVTRKATLMSCSVQSLLYNTFSSARKSRKAQRQSLILREKLPLLQPSLLLSVCCVCACHDH